MKFVELPYGSNSWAQSSTKQSYPTLALSVNLPRLPSMLALAVTNKLGEMQARIDCRYALREILDL
jgi:hypothetical protein